MNWNCTRPVAALAFILALGLAGMAGAKEKVLARVDGKPVTEADLALVEEELRSQISGMTEERKRKLLFDYAVELQVMANAAEKAGYGKDAAFKARLDYLRRRALRDVLFVKQIRDTVSEKTAKSIYEKEVAKFKPAEEFHLRHILVKTVEEARDIIEKLNRGADFAELAKEKSTGPSGQRGGDLGWHKRDAQLVKPFKEAAFKLKKGELSEPVETQFGWHVIRVDEVRNTKPPSFDDVKSELLNALIREKAQDVFSKLRGAAKIEVVDPAFKDKPAEEADKGGKDGEKKKQ